MLLLLPLAAFSQEESRASRVGMLQLGYRSTLSAFSDIGYYGLGSGAQFRILLATGLNTEWYYDYISTNVGGLGRRSDQHIISRQETVLIILLSAVIIPTELLPAEAVQLYMQASVPISDWERMPILHSKPRI
jgi:hypothetical protein